MKKEELIELIEGKINTLEKEEVKFKEKFSKNYLNAIDWSDSYIGDLCLLKEYRTLLEHFNADKDLTVEKVINYYTNLVLRESQRVANSTSASSVMVENARKCANANILNAIKNCY